MDVSENSGTPKSSISIGFSIKNHSFWGTPIFGNPHLVLYHICEKKAGPPPQKISKNVSLVFLFVCFEDSDLFFPHAFWWAFRGFKFIGKT